MTTLNEQQKELLFDYCLGLTSESETSQAQELVFSNEEAAKFVTTLKASLSPLESITPEECPAELAEGTIWRARQVVRTSQVRLTQLITAEQNRKSAPVSFWRNLVGQLATAAVFIIVGSTLISGTRVASDYAHQKYWQNRCGAQMAGMYQSLSNYRADNDGQMPTFASEAGTPWWKVSDQGSANVSNTRKMWILVKQNYAKPEDFICPAQKASNPLAYDLSYNPKEYNDFPRRSFVTYSFRIGCPKKVMGDVGRQVIIADMSPIFESLPALSERLSVNVDDTMLKQNSPNHRGRGQNILFCDGSVTFVKVRYADISHDDIFTLQNTRTYQGVELPASEADAFLAP